jgi:hypothetical protein
MGRPHTTGDCGEVDGFREGLNPSGLALFVKGKNGNKSITVIPVPNTHRPAWRSMHNCDDFAPDHRAGGQNDNRIDLGRDALWTP